MSARFSLQTPQMRLGWSLLQLALGMVALIYILQAVLVFLAADDRARAGLAWRLPLPDRIAAVLQALDAADPAERALLLRVVNDSDFRVTVLPPQQLPEQMFDGSQRWLSQTIMGYLPPDMREVGESITLRYVLASETPLIAKQLDVHARLSSGEVVAITSTNGSIPYISAIWSVTGLGLLGVLLVGGALIFIRRLLAPLSAVATAADRIGEDVNSPPMPERGPQELVKVAQAFNGMQARLKALLTQRTQMLAGIAHDLRTVLTRQRLRAEHLPDPAMRAKALDDFDFMLRVIDTHLDFAKTDEPNEPPTRFDIADLARDLSEDSVLDGRAGSYEGAKSVTMNGRPDALRRMLANLIDNACAYGGRADVTCGSEGDIVRVTVGDRGPGVPAALREAVFEPYRRGFEGPSDPTGAQHMGLGLATARAIVRQHGGSISIEDRAGGGALFVVTLPQATAPDAPYPRAPARALK